MDIFPSLPRPTPCSSLHAYGWRHTNPYRYVWFILAFFSASIVIATMFLRWHWFVDVVAGVMLAGSWRGSAASWSPSARPTAAATATSASRSGSPSSGAVVAAPSPTRSSRAPRLQGSPAWNSTVLLLGTAQSGPVRGWTSAPVRAGDALAFQAPHLSLFISFWRVLGVQRSLRRTPCSGPTATRPRAIVVEAGFVLGVGDRPTHRGRRSSGPLFYRGIPSGNQPTLVLMRRLAKMRTWICVFR
ncbi:MAG: hypothetical protein IPG17_14755 [Sandaracinaceae bacterium]|nr:hypothetical protein [Sandaracinaceae bacterium]